MMIPTSKIDLSVVKLIGESKQSTNEEEGETLTIDILNLVKLNIKEMLKHLL